MLHRRCNLFVRKTLRKPLVAAALAGLVVAAAQQPVRSETRIALVVGNADYAGERLRNPPNDARLMAETLRELGFTVIERLDADRRQMKRAVQELHDRLAQAGRDAVGLFYYSGHGVQAQQQNYLVPIGAAIERESDAEIEGVPVPWLVAQMTEAGNRLNIVVLDACRNAVGMTRQFRSRRTGLARMDAASGTLIAYATAPGGVAADGEGDNSPYTAALARAMRIPGLPVELVFKKVRIEVEEATGGRQTPWEATSLRGDFAFARARSHPAEAPAAPQSVAAPALAAPAPLSLAEPAPVAWPASALRQGAASAAGGHVPFGGLPAAALASAAVAQALSQIQVAGGSARPAIQPMERTMAVIAPAARVRALPGLDQAQLALLPEGATAAVTGRSVQGDWYRVALADGRVGFVAARLLADPQEAAAAPRRRAEPAKECPECPEMAAIEPGRFTMGSTAEQARRDQIPPEFAAYEQPPHMVEIARRFAIGRFEVTRAQFAAFATETGFKAQGCTIWSGGQQRHDPLAGWQSPGFPQTDDDPVTCVNWDEARAYAAWLSRKTGRLYRLPSEAEWEFAARAGSTASRPWGDEPAEACAHANGHDQTGHRVNVAAWAPHPCNDGRAATARVGSYRANAFGLHDMLGNVAEWVQDCWHAGYAAAPADGSPWIDPGCAMRVLRGGSWAGGPSRLRSSYRQPADPAERFNDVGFRLVRE